ncbi:hypothetical protein [Sphingobacterium bambusae]|uniref:Uncharacterized protein n=1 Tax=Sphingobacterium bambusae TaxID=662858 RepID=A0ABW6BJ53_9SPHI|nr:hypothetical protein [Sphingobacterium bambusae]WPL49704.1 hypothetical protein SCB77_04465 [Sphingobacterium bambusae]
MIFNLQLLFASFMTVFTVQQQDQELYKAWKIVAEERLYLNLDGSAHSAFLNRLDSAKSEATVFTFLPDGTFQSAEGNGTFKASADSIHLRISDKTTSFKFTLKDNSLYLYNDVKKEDHIRREMLHAQPL